LSSNRTPWRSFSNQRSRRSCRDGTNWCCAAPIGECLARALRERLFGPEDAYEDRLARMSSGELSPAEQQEWADGLLEVLTGLKGDHAGLADVAVMLIDGELEAALDRWRDSARSVHEDIAALATECAADVREMGAMKLVKVVLPRERHAFWAEVSAAARRAAGAELSLCHLAGRSVVVLGREAECRADLRAWARYLTDSMAGAQALAETEDAVPVVVDALARQPALLERVLDILREGAHLLPG